MMKKAASLLIVAMILFITGCEATKSEGSEPASISNTSAPELKLEEYVKKLCSKEFGGRAPGSIGNDLAIEWLCGQLEAIGAIPYDGSDYRMGFTADCYAFEENEVVVYETGGGSRPLVQGRDYFFSLTGNFDAEIKNGFDYRLISSDEQAGVSEGELSEKFSDYNYIIFESDVFKGNMYVDERKPLRIAVTSEVFDYLSRESIERLRIKNKVSVKEKEVYNVVGRIPGKNPQKAVVIMAHFDHLGVAGETYFPGALDNASGTASLLYVAELLAEASSIEPFDFDVVLAFVNDEERFIVGSKALAPRVVADYESLICINIDCVGSAMADNVYPMGNANCKELVGDLIGYMEKYGITASDDDMLVSDHASFIGLNVPAAGFLLEGFHDIHGAHTNTNDYKALDYRQVAAISGMIADFVRNNGTKQYKVSQALPPRPSPPPEVANEFMDLYAKIKKGEEFICSDALAGYMRNSGSNKYTYAEYVKIDKHISELKRIGDFRLELISQKSDGALQSFIFLHNTVKRNGTVEGLQIAININLPDDLFEISPIDGMEGYYTVKNLTENSFSGFVREKGDTTYVVMVGTLFADKDALYMGIVNLPNRNLDSLKTYINDIDFDNFAEQIEEYLSYGE